MRTVFRWLTLAAVLTGLTACAAANPSTPSTPSTQAEPAEVVTPSTEDVATGLGPAADDEATAPDPQTPQPPQPQQTEPADEDCVSYHPDNLSVTASGGTWTLRDGNHAMKVLASQADANTAKAVARQWTELCFIGRDNDRDDRYRYIITYFRSPSGLKSLIAASPDCIDYNPATLAVHFGSPHPAAPDQNDYGLFSGGVPLVFLASEPDALRAQLVAAANTRVCVIGHGNGKPDPTRYYLYYWVMAG
jgi:hypothetical protein